MKFREWLRNMEENISRNRVMGNTDMTRGLGPTSQYGHSAMKPISIGIDNRAAAGVIDGIGDARAKIRARKGAEPGVASQYNMWDELKRDGITVIYLPLQLPGMDSGLARSPISATKGLVQMLKSGGDPLESDRVWKVDENSMRLAGKPTGRDANRLFYLEDGSKGDHQEFTDAKEFTTALMYASIAVKLEKYAHRLNTDRPRIKDQKFEEVPLGAEEAGDKEIKYVVMMCSFVLTSKYKDQEMDGELRGEIDRILSGDKAQQHPNSPRPGTGISDEDKRRSLASLSGLTGPVTANKGSNP